MLKNNRISWPNVLGVSAIKTLVLTLVQATVSPVCTSSEISSLTELRSTIIVRKFCTLEKTFSKLLPSKREKVSEG